MHVGKSCSSPDAPKQYVFAEAGGPAAHAAFRMLRGTIPLDRMLMVDANPAKLVFWERLGVGVCHEILLCNQLHGELDVVPCDEYLRAGSPELKSSFTEADCGRVHHKGLCHGALEGRLTQSRLPARVGPVVSRRVVGAGSKGLFRSSPDELVTVAVPAVAEAVVDFNTRADLYLPRLTHQLLHGADTYCTLIGTESPQYEALRRATSEVAFLLGIDGVGNVQFVQDAHGEWWFVEAAARVSGSSWLNLQVGSNVLLGTHGDPFGELPCTTLGGGVFA